MKAETRVKPKLSVSSRERRMHSISLTSGGKKFHRAPITSSQLKSLKEFVRLITVNTSTIQADSFLRCYAGRVSNAWYTADSTGEFFWRGMGERGDGGC